LSYTHREGRLRLTETAYADLQALLGELAFVLLPHGITPETFSALAREAFTRAAAERSRLRNGRINQSKIAALTGLSRREVKRILEIDHSARSSERNRSARTPSERVVQGWLTDRRFLTRKGEPKMLAISGRMSSFQRLVKEYGGDISPRGVLDELVRSSAIRRIGQRVELRVSKLHNSSVGLGTFSRIIPVLIDGLRIVSTAQRPPIDSMVHRLRLRAHSETELELIRERCQSAIQSLLYGLQNSLRHPLTVPASRRPLKYALDVTALIADARPGHVSGSGGRRR
jgi:hypothetical protein